MTLRVLIICGGGASSGFLAQGMRRAAKASGVSATIEARSETELGDYVDQVDAVLVGPHLSFMEDEIRVIAEPHGVKVGVVPHAIYGRLDGPGAFRMARDLVGDGEVSA